MSNFHFFFLFDKQKNSSTEIRNFLKRRFLSFRTWMQPLKVVLHGTIRNDPF